MQKQSGLRVFLAGLPRPQRLMHIGGTLPLFRPNRRKRGKSVMHRSEKGKPAPVAVAWFATAGTESILIKPAIAGSAIGLSGEGFCF